MTTYEQLPINEVATLLRGITPAKTVDGLEPVPFFGLTEITAHGRVSRAPEPMLDLSDAVRLQDGDIVVALMGNLGAAAVVRGAAAGAVLGRECAALRLRLATPVMPEWVALALASEPMKAHIATLASGATMPRLPIRALGELLLPVPPVEYQRQITGRLARLDKAITAQQDLVAALGKLRDAEAALASAELMEADDAT